MAQFCRKPFRGGESKRSLGGAFTLLELLAVIAIIGILAALLLPALAGAKAKAQAATCLNNERQLALACAIYTDEFADRLPYNLGESEIRQSVAQNLFLNWTSPIMDWEPVPDNTNTALLTEGGIGPYTSRNAAIYRCPVDNAVSDLQAQQGWPHRVRSVSMNAMVGDAGSFSLSGSNTNNPGYKQFFRVTQIPQPSQIFIFIEEHANSISDGYLINNSADYYWLRLPASYHRGRVNLSFTDGHVEGHQWLDASTKAPVRPGEAYLPIEATERRDFSWLLYRTSTEDYSGGWGSGHYP